MGATFLAAVIRSFSCKYSLASITDDAWLSSPLYSVCTLHMLLTHPLNCWGRGWLVHLWKQDHRKWRYRCKHLDYQSPCILPFEITFQSSESWGLSKTLGLGIIKVHTFIWIICTFGADMDKAPMQFWILQIWQFMSFFFAQYSWSQHSQLHFACRKQTTEVTVCTHHRQYSACK